MEHVLGVKSAKVGMEDYSFPQFHSPALAIRGHFPAGGQHRHILTRVRVDVKERLHHRAELGQQAAGAGPGEVGFFGWDGEGDPQAVNFGLRGAGGFRGRLRGCCGGLLGGRRLARAQ